MPGSFPVLQLGPATYEVSATVTGGQLVMVDGSTGKVKPTTGAVATCIGMATNDAVPAGSGSQLNYATARKEVAVAYGPSEVILTVASGGTALAFGDLVVAAANGQCSKGTTPTYDLIVGRCTEPGGIATGATGRVRLF
ncbi:MAG: hypothetical protein JWO67_4854 [Streptosporangiaceae bacterium]|nr:hypothetical protein [Streptosporangiaceae bacterium]